MEDVQALVGGIRQKPESAAKAIGIPLDSEETDAVHDSLIEQFPLKTQEEFEAFENRLQDGQFKKRAVSTILCWLHLILYFLHLLN